MSTLYLGITIFGLVVLVLGLLSGPIKNRTVLSEPLIATAVGVLVGPAVLGWLDIANWGNQNTILMESARLTLAIALMSVALRLPVDYLQKNWKSVTLILALAMPLMWLSSSLLIYLFLGLPILTALLIGAIISPTDPVVASSIVTGDVAEENIPGRLRQLLSAESGANDGLGLPFVMLPMLLINRPPQEAIQHWLLTILLWEVLAAVLLAVFIGYVTGRIMRWSKQRAGEQENLSLLTVSLALSLTVLGAMRLLNMDGILGVFATGIALNWTVGQKIDERQETIQEPIKRFFEIPVFILLGISLPWAAWAELGWLALGLALAILLLRRPPFLPLLRPLLAPIQHNRDALFTGWFGPIGIAALFYATLAVHDTGNSRPWEIASLVIFISIIVHGISATPLTRLYGARMHEQQSDGKQPAAQPR